MYPLQVQDCCKIILDLFNSLVAKFCSLNWPKNPCQELGVPSCRGEISYVPGARTCRTLPLVKLFTHPSFIARSEGRRGGLRVSQTGNCYAWKMSEILNDFYA